MTINYQVIVDSVSSMLLVGFPIVLIMDVAQRLISIMINFITGKRVDL